MRRRAPGDLVRVKSIASGVSMEWLCSDPTELVGRLGVISAPATHGLYPVWLEGFEHQRAVLFRPEELERP